ncbi:hypothetical protein PInf_014750 [Phytophthora infestans]|nr:hypothetical protein PInf_014750 [Phytophthora infestans]
MKVVSAANSRQLEKRFTFLWSSAHTLLPTSPTLANHMIATMMQLARSSRAQLPQPVLDFICKNCGGLLSPANRRLTRQQRCIQQQNGSNDPRLAREALSTIVRVTCHRCQHANDRPGASIVYKAKTKKRAREEQETEFTSAGEAKKLKADNNEPGKTEEIKAASTDELKTAPTNVFVPPPSPPRKLLDGPKRKKKKKKTQPDAAAVAVKSSLSSFLQGLNSRK